MQNRTLAPLLSFPDWTLDKESLTFSLDAVLPEQVYADPLSARVGGPEASLMRAIMEDAIVCFQYQFYIPGTRAQRLAREAEKWFFSDDTEWPFTFVNICTVLGFNPEYIREGLRRWYVKHPPKMKRRKRRAVGALGALKLAA
jgi:hypothetical protein